MPRKMGTKPRIIVTVTLWVFIFSAVMVTETVRAGMKIDWVTRLGFSVAVGLGAVAVIRATDWIIDRFSSHKNSK